MLSILLVVAVGGVAAQSWFKSVPRPTAVYYVAPHPESPIRDGKSERSPLSLADVETRNVTAGELYLLTDGLYATTFKLGKNMSGNETHPVIVAAKAGSRVTIVGKVDIDGDHIWFMDIEVTDPNNLDKNSGAGIDVRGNYARVINCIVHDTVEGHGINAFYGAKGQVIYGNIVYKTGIVSGRAGELPYDAIHATNAVAKDGVKYIVGNLVVGSDDVCSKCYGFGGVSDPKDNEFDVERADGFHLESNIFERSMCQVGGYGPPTQQNVIKKNYFAASELQIGLASPAQAEVTENLIVFKYFDFRYMWTTSDPAYGLPQSRIVVRQNSIFYPPMDMALGTIDDLPMVDFGTAQYASADDKNKHGARPVLGGVALNSGDVVDGNIYDSGLTGHFRLNAANNGGVRCDTLDAWRNASAAAGVTFDRSSSSMNTSTMASTAIVVPNLYDRLRAYIVVFNYAQNANITVSLREAFAGLAGTFKIHASTARWNTTPIAEGVLPTDKVNLNVGTARVSTWIAVANEGVDPNQVPRMNEFDSICPRFSDGCEAGKCKPTAPACLLETLVCASNGFCSLKMASAVRVSSSGALLALALVALYNVLN